ncbi:MAG TPA: HAMP domain-containing sensor histidine kinase [Gaiellaceae bacterium]|nr:HAMP domain-containing sensor histidine kinase [Gaiellaceae bacterium]
MSLRARLILGTACTLAAAIAAGLFVAYAVVKGELRGEIDRSLVAFSRPFVERASSGLQPGQLPGGKIISRSRRTGAFGGAAGYFQFVSADGKTQLAPSEQVHLPVGRAPAVAAGTHKAYYSEATVSGVKLRVYTVRINESTALEIARPLTEVDHALDRIGLLFLIISLVAVGGAAAVGLLVARATLRPVTQLTEDAERIAATRSLRERTDQSRSGELGRLAVAFNTMLDALTDSVSAQRQLIADASHELRTPLASARTNLEVLELHGGLTPDTRERILAEAVEELREMTQLIDELVELARGDVQAFALSPVRLDQVTEDAVAVTARRSGREIRLDKSPTVVSGSIEPLSRAIANLLDNAVKWSPAGKPIEVSVSSGTVCVRDHGPGIDPEDLPHVFDRFYRATAARTLPGSGLGLAIVKQVAEAHGGTITVEAAPGGGAIFSLRLPDLSVPAAS